MNKVQPHFISIYGTEGTLLVGWQESKYRCNGDDDWTVFGTGYDKSAAFRNQVYNFVGAIYGMEELALDPEDAIASVLTIETAYQALRSEKWHAVTQARKQPSRPPLGEPRIDNAHESSHSIHRNQRKRRRTGE
jgi:predicted dehydrogenase